MHIAGATVLLTGVTGGIGGAIAAEMAARGARLILTGRRREALEPLADRYGARTILADLADADDVLHLTEEAAGTDILIANAALPSS
ncbi:SDR family NAD(P)-dependent oxidoreductase, partial [Streptomyces sp. SID2955]|nr:SDR family NAD(P)-dependent oxidoreductase [Streptomyces sp. SID2955]